MHQTASSSAQTGAAKFRSGLQEQYMKHIYSIFLTLAVVFAAGFAVSAQETEERVVDEVVAQVNDGVITLSRINREVKDIVDLEVQNGKKREDAQKQIDEKRGELIANMINEELLVQKAKELGLDSDADAAVNERFVQMMKQYGMKNIDQLHQEMEKQGVDPSAIREMWRKQAIKDLVIQREVQQKEYWKPSGKELRDYYEKNKARFTKPETVSFSEIFLGFAGRDENAVREKAKQIVEQLRGGADFAKLQAENSDPGVVTQGKGKVEKVKPSEFSEIITNAIKGRKPGEVTDPIEAGNIGMVVLKIDARESATSESFFDESAVRSAIFQERAPAALKNFMASLRENSYIKIGESYRPIVSPILYADERKDKTAAPGDDKKDKAPAKSDDKKDKAGEKASAKNGGSGEKKPK